MNEINECQSSYNIKPLNSSLKKSVSICAAIMILYIILIHFYNIAIIVGANLIAGNGFPLNKDEYVKALYYYFTLNPNMSLIQNFITQILALITSIPVSLKIFGVKIRDVSPSFKVKNKGWSKEYIVRTFPPLLLLNYVFGTIIAIVASAITMVFKYEPPKVDLSPGGQDSFSIIIFFVSLCVFAPLIEEILFRGYLLNILKPHGAKLAVVITSIAFGLLHGYLQQGFVAFVIGIVLGYVAIKTNSILPSIILHGLTNFVSFSVYFLPLNKEVDSMSEFETIGVALTIGAILLICILGLVFIFQKKFRVNFKGENPSVINALTYKDIFINPFVIMYIIIQIVMFNK